MASTQPKEKKFHWKKDEQKLLLVICREYHKKNGVDTHFNWNEIAEKFMARGGRNVTAKEAKNKFDYMKPIWRAWSDLRHKETGAGWDERTRTIRASDEWWNMKLAESDKYKRFRNKPVDPELSELWDAVYGSICATGQYAMSANMDRTPLPTTDGDNDGSQYDIGSEDEDAYEQFGDPVDLTLNEDSPIGSPAPTPAAQKRTTVTENAPRAQKRKKKRTSAVTEYKNCMASIEVSNSKVVNMLEGELGCTGSTSKPKECELQEAIEIIDRMVSEGAMRVADRLWCFAVDELTNEGSRRLFMTLKTDVERLAWLDYKYKKQA